ncbi:hypothetical protein H6G76_35105 [Nostoc sp. FACHB-152]|uniref:phage tail protein n=1 Tax=Nostoc sp. FACHB-152 TaxID=2692837 RepID=UPI001688D22F|nr:phage tail protein [Nostoc sp. FACHB-152]MBD2452240.1 hypothetical protein [Nostoc sp. FACHB-152]
MTTTYQAWQTGRPIFSRLPEVYQENPVADWLTEYWDELLTQNKAKIDDLPRNLDPTTCDENWLDFLAPLCGFTGEYWDKSWKTSSKRLLLANSYTLIWKNKGSREVLSFVLNALGIEHEIWTGSSFILGVSQVSIDKLGSGAWQYKVLLPSRYAQEGYEFKLARKINRLFGPLWCKSEVRYRRDIIPEFFYNVAAVDTQTFLTSDTGELIVFQ